VPRQGRIFLLTFLAERDTLQIGSGLEVVTPM
jgi:hypothetical protein